MNQRIPTTVFQTGRFSLRTHLSLHDIEPLRTDPSPWAQDEYIYTFEATQRLVEIVRQWFDMQGLPYSKSLRILLQRRS